MTDICSPTLRQVAYNALIYYWGQSVQLGSRCFGSVLHTASHRPECCRADEEFVEKVKTIGLEGCLADAHHRSFAQWVSLEGILSES